LEAEISPHVDSNEKSKLLHTTQVVETHCNIVEDCIKLYTKNCKDLVSSSCNFSLKLTGPKIWTLYFDGSRNKEGAGPSFLLIDLHGNRMMNAYFLEFECINNVDEYEAIMQGLRKALDLQVKCIEVFRDSQIVICQVRNSINCTSNYLKNYEREVWELINKFESFNIKSIPHSMNSKEDMLANAASNLCLSDDFSHDKFSVELIYMPSIPNNITNWIVFKDNGQIINFLHSEDTFKG
jgi:ribonuclease HI